MTNQTIGKNVTGSPSLTGHRNISMRILVALGILAVVLVTAFILDRPKASIENVPARVGNLSALPDDGRAFYTEPYWEAAKAAEAAAASKNLSALPDDGRAFYTEPYWEAAKAAEAAAASKNLSALPDDGRAFYTEPYWEAGKVTND